MEHSSKAKSDGLAIVGYSDRLSVPPDDTIRFMVSCEADTYEADLVHVTGGGLRPGHTGPSVRLESVAAPCAGQHGGSRQGIRSGSYVRYGPTVLSVPSLTALAWIYPTLPAAGRGQAIIAAHGPEVGTGFVLGISDKGHLALSVDGWDGHELGACPSASTRCQQLVPCRSFTQQQHGAFYAWAVSPGVPFPRWCDRSVGGDR